MRTGPSTRTLCGKLRRLIDAVGSALRNAHNASHDVVASATIFGWASRYRPSMRPARRNHKRVRPQIATPERLVSEIEKLTSGNMFENLRGKRVDTRIDQFAALGTFRRFLLKADDLTALVRNHDAVLVDLFTLYQPDRRQCIALRWNSNNRSSRRSVTSSQPITTNGSRRKKSCSFFTPPALPSSSGS